MKPTYRQAVPYDQAPPLRRGQCAAARAHAERDDHDGTECRCNHCLGHCACGQRERFLRQFGSPGPSPYAECRFCGDVFSKHDRASDPGCPA